MTLSLNEVYVDIQNKSVLVIGGWGLVGRAIARKLVPENPSKIIITSLRKEEALEAVAELEKEFPGLPKGFFVPWWGNILVRNEFKDKNRAELLKDPKSRRTLIKDIMEELDDDILKNSALYKLIAKYKPEIIIDSINTATGIAYQNLYVLYRDMKPSLTSGDYKALAEHTEIFLASQYIPQLIRHIQILYNAMHFANTKIFVKIGTSGTGGMGLNIPYTHSEEKPSRVLLSKSAVAGAHSLLLFLMARTPDSAITKEIKPTAAIAWKRIGYGVIKKQGKPIELIDSSFENAVTLSKTFSFTPPKNLRKTGKQLKSVFIDTGENGIFSRGEFEAITAQKQMQYITPEEIAQDTIFEIRGGNTGRDVINALDNATAHPTYRAGYMQHFAVDRLAELEQLNEVDSVAFEMLGPPRLSKLLFELHLLRKAFGTMKAVVAATPAQLTKKCLEVVKENPDLRSEIVSIGIPILLPDGKTLLRGENLKIPVKTAAELPIKKNSIDDWASDGWVDLREKNMRLWLNRLRELMDEANMIPADDTSSQHVRTKYYWNNFERIDVGRVVSWIFIHEEKGNRMKD